MSFDPDFAEIERKHELPPDELYSNAEDLPPCPQCGDDFPACRYNLHFEVVAFECRECGHEWGAQ